MIAFPYILPPFYVSAQKLEVQKAREHTIPNLVNIIRGLAEWVYFPENVLEN